jgi:hypothetical protein
MEMHIITPTITTPAGDVITPAAMHHILNVVDGRPVIVPPPVTPPPIETSPVP